MKRQSLALTSLFLASSFVTTAAWADTYSGTLNSENSRIPIELLGTPTGTEFRGDLQRAYLSNELNGSGYNVFLSFDAFDPNVYATALVITTDANGGIREDQTAFLGGLASAYMLDTTTGDGISTPHVSDYLSQNVVGLEYAAVGFQPNTNTDVNAFLAMNNSGPISFQSGTEYWAWVGIVGGPIALNAPLDSVNYTLTVSPVPEAETWMMMILGLAGMSAWLRRNRRRTIDQASHGLQ